MRGRPEYALELAQIRQGAAVAANKMRLSEQVAEDKIFYMRFRG